MNAVDPLKDYFDEAINARGELLRAELIVYRERDGMVVKETVTQRARANGKGFTIDQSVERIKG